jgi:hypothetical protein
VASIEGLAKPPCVLALTKSITFQGSPTLTSPTCGVASNNPANDGIAFTGNNGIDFDAPSYTVGGCTQTAASGISCTSVQTYQQTFPDPLAGLDGAMKALKLAGFPNGKCIGSILTSYETGQCYNDGNPTFPSTLSGTYYFTGNVKINGSPTISGTATLIFFAGATLTITGSPTIQLTAMMSPAGPAVLSSVAGLMKGLLIYDGEAWSKNGINISGSSASYFNGTVYVPNTPVTYGGNSSASAPTGDNACYQVIAYSVNFQGNTKLDNAGCSSTGAVKPDVQTVRLVSSWQ